MSLWKSYLKKEGKWFPQILHIGKSSSLGIRDFPLILDRCTNGRHGLCKEKSGKMAAVVVS